MKCCGMSFVVVICLLLSVGYSEQESLRVLVDETRSVRGCIGSFWSHSWFFVRNAGFRPRRSMPVISSMLSPRKSLATRTCNKMSSNLEFGWFNSISMENINEFMTSQFPWKKLIWMPCVRNSNRVVILKPGLLLWMHEMFLLRICSKRLLKF